MRRLQADLLLLFAAAIWGLAFVFQKSAMSHIEPMTFIAARSAVAALALAPLALFERRRAGRPARSGLAATAGTGATLFFLGAVFQQQGLVWSTVTNTGFVTALYVVITPLIAWGLAGRRPLLIVWPAIALSFVGTWLLGGGSFGAVAHGDLLVAIGAIFWAGHVVLTAQASAFARPLAFTCLQFAGVAVIASVGAAMAETVTLGGLVAAAPAIAYVGLLSSALAFSILVFALEQSTPAEAAIIASTETVFAALAAYLLIGERLGATGWIGAALILAGVLLVQLAPLLRPADHRAGS